MTFEHNLDIMKALRAFVYMVMIASLFQCKSSSKSMQVTTTTASLVNTHWRLSEVNGEPLQTPDGAREVHILLVQSDGENQLKGYAGCNTIAGTFNQDGEELTFSAASTRMMCPPAQMKVEDFLLKALSTADHYEIKGETLTLLQGETALATFRSVFK